MVFGLSSGPLVYPLHFIGGEEPSVRRLSSSQDVLNFLCTTRCNELPNYALSCVVKVFRYNSFEMRMEPSSYLCEVVSFGQ